MASETEIKFKTRTVFTVRFESIERADQIRQAVALANVQRERDGLTPLSLNQWCLQALERCARTERIDRVRRQSVPVAGRSARDSLSQQGQSDEPMAEDANRCDQGTAEPQATDGADPR